MLRTGSRAKASPCTPEALQAKSLGCDRADVTCSYLTTAFEKHPYEAHLNATNRVAIAGPRVLYNTLHLRNRRVAAEGRTWTTADWSSMRYYALTMNGSQFTFWCLQPHEAALSGNEWTGCCMKCLEWAECGYLNKIEGVCDWLNEIYRWGMTEHALDCENDIEIVGRVRER